MSAPICPVLHQTVPEIILGVVLLLGVVVSYGFQWYNILSRKSAEGLSFIMLFVGIASCFTTVVNSLILQFNRFVCCSTTSSLGCIENLMAFIQVTLTFLAFFPVYLMYLYFAPLKKEFPRRHMVAVILFFVLVLFCAATGLAAYLLLHMLGPEATATRAYAYGLGVLTMVATVCQWTPQIIQTMVTKNVGQLSLVLLAIQGPGNAIYAFFLGFTMEVSVTTYLPFALSSAQQCFLLAVCFVFWWRARQEAKRQELLRAPDKAPNALRDIADADESTPLTRGGTSMAASSYDDVSHTDTKVDKGEGPGDV